MTEGTDARHEDARLLAQARLWAAQDPDPRTKKEMEALVEAGDLTELADRFGERLEFGTAGIRGLLGAGPARMNRLLVRRVTAGLARYLLEQIPDARERGVVVGRDARHGSVAFAEETAGVLAAAGLPVFLFEGEVSTPLCAFAVTGLGAAAGVMITASHNPPEYNGYKVYAANGAQIVPPADASISRAIDEVGRGGKVQVLDPPRAKAAGLLRPVPEEVRERYLEGCLSLRCHPELAPDLRIVYTPLHGVGGRWVKELFERAGFRDVFFVREQAEPDPDFPTVRFPNPEEKGAMDLAAAEGERRHADLILANDPDADRLAVLVPGGEEGGFRALSGNEIGLLLAYYLLTEGGEGEGRLVMTTIVSSSLLGRMARELGVAYAETLTGFKWIANRAMELEREQGLRFVLGFEEALGYTVGDLVRDKDGVGTALVFADLTLFCRARGGSVLGMLEEIYRRFGVVRGAQHSVTLPGREGMDRIGRIMEAFRKDPPRSLGGADVIARSDVQTGRREDAATGESTPLELPSSNVLLYELGEGSRILLRPSGTEPKIKYYFEVNVPFPEGATLREAEARAGSRLEELQKGFLAEVDRRTRTERG
jgi:phosphomannomutase